MQVIIIGNNRAEICKIKTVDFEKHWLQCRGQLYKVYPDGLTRIDCIDGEKITSDECIIYAENEIVPYHPRHVDYRLDTQLREIDEHKLMSYSNFLGKAQIFFKKAGKAWAEFAPYAGLCLVGLIVLWAFLQ